MTVAADTQRLKHRGNLALTWTDMACLAAPLLMAVQVSMIGHLFGTEIVLLALLPGTLLAGGLARLGSLPTRILLLAGLWLWGQMVTDLLRGSAFTDYSRGWLRIVFLASNFLAIYLLAEGERRRVKLFAIGLSVGLFLETLTDPNIFFSGDRWKFGYSIPALLLVGLAASSEIVQRHRFLAPAFILAAAALNLALGDRGHAGMCFVAGAFLLGRDVRRPANGRAPASPARVALLALALFAAGFGFLKIYEHAAGSGMLGRAEQQKYLLEAAGTGGVILGGRPEILVSLRAIEQEPVIGHGSYAPDSSFLAELNSELRARGYSTTYDSSSGMIPTHSHLFGAWVEGGILGAVFWFAVLVLAARVLLVTFRRHEPLAPLAAVVATMMLWDVVFSPYGAERRVIVAWAFVLFVTVLESVAPDRRQTFA